MITKLAVLVLSLAMTTGVLAAQSPFHIIPKPQHLTAQAGSFVLDGHTSVAAPDSPRARQIVAFLRRAIRRQTGIHLVAGKAGAKAGIELRIDPSVKGSEAYHLSVAPRGIVIAASDDRGLFWGVQTLRQLLPLGKRASVKIPSVRIADAPRYPWRGVMLDVSRHFMPLSFVKKQISLMSYYKFNVLHWHLTDDQGWRIQIRKYPKLTRVGAWRTEADGKRYGGFYTPQQIRDVVAYARKRNVRVVPEIEMPGHSSAAIAAYPSLSCSGRQIQVPTTWGVFRNVDCIDGHTFKFLDNVLDEVIKLFPSPYVHIGGDEVPQGVWDDCKPCKKLERSKGIHGEKQLHSYFIERIRKYLASKGKTMVGWDEILEGGVSPKAVVEVWRGPSGAAQALANGNRILIAGPFYLDASIGNRTLEDLYRNDPFTNSLIADHPRQVLGGEAPLWSERVLTVPNAEAKLYPRLFAVSEHLWNPDAHDWADFKRRVNDQYAWLAAHHVAYGPADQDIVDYSLSFNPGYHRWRIRAERGFDDMRMRYTTDGSQPTAESPSFGNVLDLYEPATIEVAPFRHGVQYEVPTTFHVVENRALGKPVTYAAPPSPEYAGGKLQLVNGVLGTTDFHDGNWTGWQGTDMDATIDLEKPAAMHAVEVQFLQSAGSWILLPKSVRFEVSADGKAWKTMKNVSVKDATAADRVQIRNVTASFSAPVTARYVRVQAVPRAMQVPERQSYIFADEIIVH